MKTARGRLESLFIFFVNDFSLPPPPPPPPPPPLLKTLSVLMVSLEGCMVDGGGGRGFVYRAF